MMQTDIIVNLCHQVHSFKFYSTYILQIMVLPIPLPENDRLWKIRNILDNLNKVF